MRLIAHIIWKDVRSLRWPLLIWASLYLVQIALGLVIFHHDQGEHEFVGDVSLGNVILVSAQFVTAYLLIVQWVQADAVTGTRMFWLTRPISTVRLVRAKGWGLLLVFGLLPVLLKLPWWLYCGFTAGDVAWAALDTLGWQLLLVAPAFMIASLTDDFGRALMWGLLLLIVLIGGVVYLYSRNFFNAIAGFSLRLPGGLGYCKLWVTGILLIGGSLLVATHQIRTRRTLRSLVLAIVMVSGSLLAGRAWPYDAAALFTQFNEPDPIPESNAYPDLQVSLGGLTLDGATWHAGDKEGRLWIEQNMQVMGLPEGWSLIEARASQLWSEQTNPAPIVQRTTTFSDWSLGELRRILELPAWPGDAETVRWHEAQNLQRKERGELVTKWAALYWGPQQPRQEAHALLFGRTPFRVSEVARIRAAGASGEATVDLKLGRPKILFEMPLTPGAVWAGSSRAYRLGPWEPRDDGGSKLLLTTARPAVRQFGLWNAGEADPSVRRWSLPDFDLQVINRRNHTIGGVTSSGDTARAGAIVIAGVHLRWSITRVSFPKVIRNGKWVAADPDWSEHSSLVQVQSVQTIRLKRTLQPGAQDLPWPDIEKAQADLEKKRLGKAL